MPSLPPDRGSIETRLEPPALLAGQVRIHRGVRSRGLRRSRDILVYLPPGYDADRSRRYPVLYFHDGQNLFDPATSFAGQDWKLDETADRMILQGAIEPVLIVAIDHAGRRRTHEFGPVRDPRAGTGGGADRYGRMLARELKVMIDAEYRTLPWREHTAMGGSSMGGLVTMYLGMRYAELFGRLAVMSPSVWWGNRAILGEVGRLENRRPTRIWLDIGSREGQVAVRDARLLRDALRAKGWTRHDLAYTEVRGARHSEADWAARAEPMLRYLFAR